VTTKVNTIETGGAGPGTSETSTPSGSKTSATTDAAGAGPSNTSTSRGGAARPTGVSELLGGVVAVIGMAVAL